MGQPDVTLTIPFGGLTSSQVWAVEQFLESGFVHRDIKLERPDAGSVIVALNRGFR